MENLGLYLDLLTREYTLAINKNDQLIGGRVEFVAIGEPSEFGGENHIVYRDWTELYSSMLTFDWNADSTPYFKFLVITFAVDSDITIDFETLKQVVSDDPSIREITLHIIPKGFEWEYSIGDDGPNSYFTVKRDAVTGNFGEAIEDRFITGYVDKINIYYE